MVNMPKWQRYLILAFVILAAIFALPNFFYKRVENHNDAQTRIELGKEEPGDPALVSAWPKLMPSDIVNMGLDLRGGVHVVVEVQTDDVYTEYYESFWATARDLLRERKDDFGNVTRKPVADQLVLEIENANEAQAVVDYLKESAKALGADDYDYQISGKDISITLTDGAKARIDDMTMERSLEIVRRRIDAAGTKEPTIQRQGENRILIDVPGFGSVEEVMALIGRTAKLSLHPVFGFVTDPNASASFDELIVPYQGEGGGFIRIGRAAVVTGDKITDASLAFSQQTNEPIVNFRLNPEGAKQFGDYTSAHINEPFAIVLDGEAISAPNIRSAILGGAAMIEGNFTVESADQLAVLLRSGALPAELVVLEQSVVGPDLGQDSIDAGSRAAIIALLIVSLYMLWSYRLYGVFASIALFVNMLMIIAALSLVGSVLTLPGIAGIVLTIGMAVDANVLIFERIREEYSIKPVLIRAVDNGFGRALSSILDANITTFIAAIVLYFFGVGPVRGFSITLMIGILTSVFTAVYVTRLLIVWYIDRRKPREIPFAKKSTFLDNRHFAFMKIARFCVMLSLVLVTLSAVLFFTKGPNYGIDFRGGTMMNIEVSQDVSVGDMRDAVSKVFEGDISVTTNSSAEEGKQGMFVRLSPDGERAAMNEEEIAALKNEITTSIAGAEVRGVDSIGGAVSGEMVEKGLLAILITLFAIGVYIWFRFEAAFSMGAIFALFHDVLLTVGFFALTGFTFDLSVVAALLAIIGYSLNDTVVVYDRIREKFEISKTEDISIVIDRAINETLTRTLMTSGTTLLAVLAILIFGGPELRSFSIAMLFGVMVGTYSSIFIASPILVRLGVSREDNRKKAQHKFADIDA